MKTTVDSYLNIHKIGHRKQTKKLPYKCIFSKSKLNVIGLMWMDFFKQCKKSQRETENKNSEQAGYLCTVTVATVTDSDLERYLFPNLKN